MTTEEIQKATRELWRNAPAPLPAWAIGVTWTILALTPVVAVLTVWLKL